MTASAPVLELRGLSRVIDAPDGKVIIDDFSFSFIRGNIYTILGPSGAGKSSLLRLINRLDEPTGGEVIFESKAQSEYSPCQLRCKIGYLFQTPHLFPGGVEDNIRFANGGISKDQLRTLLEQVHLAQELLSVSSEKLSVGEKQRVALARLLATGPTVVLLDEPTSALDPSHTEGIENLIRELAGSGKLTVVMVTHNPEQALRMGGEALLLVSGKLVEHGSAEQVVKHPKTELGLRYQSRELR